MKPETFFPVAILLLLLAPTGLFAQQNTFTTVFYDATSSGELLGYSVVETPDSGFLIAGEHNNKPMLLKMDKDGQMVWEKNYDFEYNKSYFTRIISTSDSNFIVAGNIAPSFSDSGTICMKVSQAGDVIWGRKFDFGYSIELSWIEQTNDQGYILSAYAVWPTPLLPFKTMVLKINESGSPEWSKTIAAGSSLSLVHIVREMPDSGYMIAGAMSDSGFDQSQAMMIRLSESGEIAWGKKLIAPANTYSSIYDVLVSDSSMIWYMHIEAPGASLFTTDLSGNILWSKSYNTYEGWSSYYAQKPKLHTTWDDGFIFVSPGQWTGAVQTDSLGNALWDYYVYLENVDVLSVSDSGFLFLGHGPLWGVELAPPRKPQTGLIKTDALGQTDDCLEVFWGFNDTINLVFENMFADTTSGVSTSIIDPGIDSMNVWTWDGCVAATGSIGGAHQQEENLLIITPNPTSGLVQIQTEPAGEEIKSIEIFNTTGKKVYHSEKKMALPEELNLSFLPNGIYFIRAQTDQKWYSEKIILIH